MARSVFLHMGNRMQAKLRRLTFLFFNVVLDSQVFFRFQRLVCVFG